MNHFNSSIPIILKKIFLFVILVHASFASNLFGQDTTNQSKLVAKLFYNQFPSKQEQFYNKWTPGSIKLTDGTRVTNCMIRYNGWLDELLWLRESDYKTGIVVKESVESFSFNLPDGTTQKFIKTHLRDPVTLQSGNLYVQLLVDDSVQLIVYRKVSYMKNTDVFARRFRYALYINNRYEWFTLNKSQLVSLFNPEEKLKMKKIVRSNHLRIKKEEDAIKAVLIYNQEN